jgi:hypothetical protein
MKNIQLSSRKADEEVLIAFLCAIFAAAIGFCITPPNLVFEHLRLFDATLWALLAIAFWGIYHLFDFHRLAGRRAVATLVATTLLWVLAITVLMAALHKIDTDYNSLGDSFTTMIL